MPTLYTIITGTLDGHTGCPVPDVDRHRDRLEEWAASLFGGVTVSNVRGGWIDDNGQLVRENSIRFDILIEGRDRQGDILRFADAVRLTFHQTAVLVYAVPAASWTVR